MVSGESLQDDIAVDPTPSLKELRAVGGSTMFPRRFPASRGTEMIDAQAHAAPVGVSKMEISPQKLVEFLPKVWLEICKFITINVDFDVY